jgi:hypothetical protein
MNHHIIIALAYHQENAPQCEKLLDFIYKLNDRRQTGHIVLANDSAVHAENKNRIKISAELAFEGVHQLDIRPLADINANKILRVNNAFRQVAQFIEDGFHWPFLWLEPDCTPVDKEWFAKLCFEYVTQPRSYMGSRMRVAVKEGDGQMFMARTSIYPANTASQLPKGVDIKAPFEIMSGPVVVPKMAITKKIQQLVIKSQDDISKVRPDAILVHGDKNQILMNTQEIPKTITVDSGETEIPKPVVVSNGHIPKVEPISTTPRLSRRQMRELAMQQQAGNGAEVPL